MSKKKGKEKESENIYVVNAEYLSGYNDALVDELSKFLKKQIEGKVKRDSTDVLINADKISKTKIRELLKKFLHKNDIRNAFKILSPAGKGNTLVLQRTKEV